MRTVFIVLMLLLALVVAALAMLNNEVVTVNYLFGQIDLTLFALILGSAFTGILVMVFYGLYRSIHNYVKAEGERGMKKELQRRVKLLEAEKKKLEDELNEFNKEKEIAVAKAHADLEAEKRILEEELNRQQKERDNAASKAKNELEAEKRKLEDELKKQRKELGSSEVRNEIGVTAKKGFWDFLKK